MIKELVFSVQLNFLEAKLLNSCTNTSLNFSQFLNTFGTTAE